MCLCVGVCRGATGRTIHTRTQMHTGTHRDTRAWAYMMTDLALLAWPPQDPLSASQSAAQPAGDGLQRADQPHVSRGEREGAGRGKRAREGGGGIRDRRGKSVCFDMSVSVSGCLCVCGGSVECDPCTHTDVAWNPGSSLARSWDTRIHMRHGRMRVCARECMPVACVRALVRGCVCVSVCVQVRVSTR